MSTINKAILADIDGLIPEYRERLELVFARVGNRYQVTSAYRSTVRQAMLYAAFLAGVGNPANKPGTSKHEIGEAADINPTGLNGFAELHAVAYELGFYFPYADRKTKAEPWHMELRPGRQPLAISQPPAPVTITEDEDMPKWASNYRWPNGDEAQLFADGAVYCYGAKSFGAMGDLRADAKKTFTEAASIKPVDPNDSQAGYIVFDKNGKDTWKFDASARKFFK